MNKTRLRFFVVLGLLCGLSAQRVLAIDHNNIDAGRPLSFDDAEAVAYRERSIEMGAEMHSPHDKPAGYGVDAEFLYGVALNAHMSIDLNPTWGGRSGSKETRFDPGNVSVGGLYNFNREYRNVPAFALRGDVAFPTGRDADGVDSRLRAILSKTVFQYSRLHLNLDGTFVGSPEQNMRSFKPGAILGISRPLGYPHGFNRTGVAEVAIQSSEQKGTDPVVSIGVGIRQQVSVRSVVDIGVRSDIGASNTTPHNDIQVVVGYSVGF